MSARYSRFSWIVRLTDGEVIQVDADEIEFLASGGVVFWQNVAPEGNLAERGSAHDYALFALGAGRLKQLSVMNQWCGSENGHTVLQHPTTRNKPTTGKTSGTSAKMAADLQVWIAEKIKEKKLVSATVRDLLARYETVKLGALTPNQLLEVKRELEAKVRKAAP